MSLEDANNKDRRKVLDRRANNLKKDQGFPRNRRYRPCRRLNNISVEPVTLETFIHHPSLWLKLHLLGYMHKEDKKK
jgi:hypothetical protein